MADPKKVQDAVELVEQYCGPEQMSKVDAIDFLEDVVISLESAIEALKEEIENEKEDEDGKKDT